MTYEEAERHLLSLELFGMRFGLDRMRRLLTALGAPQARFDAIHVVGTNGKSSTVRMIAALLEAHGRRTGAYFSPHLVAFTERIRVGDRDVRPEAFGAAVGRAAAAAAKVDRTGEDGDTVTQFELLTAAALDELAREEVEVAVVEAGLGGRYDATNVLRSPVQVLTNVGLEHTRWLGPTAADIAAEKLDVVQPGATLVVGADLHPDAAALARELCAQRAATLVEAPADPGVPVAAAGDFQRRNFATALTAARAYLVKLDDDAVASAATTLVPGRFEITGSHPEVVLDGAHNASGMAALAQALPAFVAGRRLVATVAVLDDKDAGEMLRVLLPHCDEVVFASVSHPRALSPATLLSLCGQLGGPPARTEPDPLAALALARELAGPDGVVLATGSLYLLADLLRPAGAKRSTL